MFFYCVSLKKNKPAFPWIGIEAVDEPDALGLVSAAGGGGGTGKPSHA